MGQAREFKVRSKDHGEIRQVFVLTTERDISKTGVEDEKACRKYEEMEEAGEEVEEDERWRRMRWNAGRRRRR